MSTLIDAGAKVGRSFSLGTFVPTVALVSWLAALLVLSPSFGSPLRWQEQPLPDITWVETGLLGAVFLVVGLAIHPLIFATTQLLEGYWGNSWLGVTASTVASARQRDRIHALDRVMVDKSDALDALTTSAHSRSVSSDVSIEEWAAGWVDDVGSKSIQGLVVARDSAARARDRYPESASRVLPTALGNALRRGEDRIGRQYGLDALSIAGHLALVVHADEATYLDDARQQLDTAVRLCSVGFIAFAVTSVWLLPTGWSLLFALVPLAFAFISYKGAVGAADEYMYTFGVVLDLNRFVLYQRLHVAQPSDVASEVDQNTQLVQMLGGIRVNLNYDHPPN